MQRDYKDNLLYKSNYSNQVVIEIDFNCEM